MSTFSLADSSLFATGVLWLKVRNNNYYYWCWCLGVCVCQERDHEHLHGVLMDCGEKGYRVVSRDTGKEHWPGFYFLFLLYTNRLYANLVSYLFLSSTYVMFGASSVLE